MTCGSIYAVCIPFIKRHNALHSRFHHFTYYKNPADPSPTIATASDLIKRIAVEPVVARYIQYADFKRDSPGSHIIHRGFVRDTDCLHDVIRLFAESPYLEHAGLNWNEYLAKIEEELNVNRIPTYSQHASTFLLTLLPNVDRLILPQFWNPLGATDRLIDAVVRKAKQSHSRFDSLSLAQVTRFEPYISQKRFDQFDLGWTRPFLALPRIRSFHGPSCVIMDANYTSIVPRDPNYTLESVSLVTCCLDDVGIAHFLKNTKRLKTLRYSHSRKYYFNPRCWDICKFVAAIEREVGSHLVELSISIREPFSSIAPGKVTMRGCACLRQLEFLLEIVMCNMAATARRVSMSDYELDNGALFLGDLVPPSVNALSLISHGTDHHGGVLAVMFWDFAAKKTTKLPALKEIHLIYPNGGDGAYKDHFTRLRAETNKAGVVLHLQPWAHSRAMTWDGTL